MIHTFTRQRNNSIFDRVSRYVHLRTYQHGCGKSKKIDVSHALDCKKGGSDTDRHDEIRDELRDLLAHVFSPSRIRCEPMINPVLMRANCTKAYVPSTFSSPDFLNADRGDLLIRFWEGRTECTALKLAEHFSRGLQRYL